MSRLKGNDVLAAIGLSAIAFGAVSRELGPQQREESHVAIRTIGIGHLDNFQIDDDGRLYWKGEQVKLEKTVRLENYQIVLAVLATAGSLLAGIHPFGHSFGWW